MDFNNQVLENIITEKIYTIAEIKEKSKAIFEKYDIKKAYLFGSYARDEATKSSDIDIMINAPEQFSLINLEQFCEALTTVFQKQIDVITEETYTRDIQHLTQDSSLYKAKKEFFKRVEKERIVIYG